MNRWHKGTIVQREKHINTTHRCVKQDYVDKDESAINSSVRALCYGCEKLVPQLHLHNGLAHRGHGGLDVKLLALIRDPAAMGLLSNETFLLFVVIHLFVQTLIALFALVIDPHSKPVLVHVIIVGHREHYSYCLFSGIAFPLKEVVGHNANCAACFGAGLGEVAHLGFQWAHSGLGWTMAASTLQENPFI